MAQKEQALHGGLCLPPLSLSYIIPAAGSLPNSLLIHASVPLYRVFLLPKCSLPHTSLIWKITACSSRNGQKSSPLQNLAWYPTAELITLSFFQTTLLSLYFIIALILAVGTWAKKSKKFWVKRRVRLKNCWFFQPHNICHLVTSDDLVVQRYGPDHSHRLMDNSHLDFWESSLLGSWLIDISHFPCPKTWSLPPQLNMTAMLCLIPALGIIYRKRSLIREVDNHGVYLVSCLFSGIAILDCQQFSHAFYPILEVFSVRELICYQLFCNSWKQKYTGCQFDLQLFVI